MRSLRERLAQFDAPPREPLRERSATAGASALAAVIESGAVPVGDAPTGHLRVEAAISPGLGAPWCTIPAATWALYGAAVPAGEHWVVIDTETTGLESGTGTLVFLVGLLHWTRERAWRVQLLLPEPAGEQGLLESLARELAPADALISYNGRAFDLTRLRSRLRLQRLDAGFLDRPHLDLLAPARRLLRRTLGDLRLGTLERALLGRPRQDDLPGEFAPEVYRTLLAEGRDVGLNAVLLHNARDVESLPALAAWFAAAAYDDADLQLPPATRLEVARLHSLRGERVRAEQMLRELAAAPLREVRTGARRELAAILRRARAFHEAACVWQAQIDDCPSDLGAHVELAKLCEHRLRDLAGAQAAVLGAMQQDRARRALGLQPQALVRRSERDPVGDDAQSSTQAQLGYRLRRIRLKLQRDCDHV